MSTIVIKSNVSKALKYYSPLIAVMLTATILLMSLMNIHNKNCEVILDVNAAYALLLFVSYLLPTIIVFFSIYMFIFGYKVLTYKCCPPIDIPVFIEKESHKNKVCYFKSIFFVFTPIMAMWLVIVGDEAYMDILDGKTKSELINKIEKDCSKSLLEK